MNYLCCKKACRVDYLSRKRSKFGLNYDAEIMTRTSSLLYLEREIIYLSTTYVKFILLAYSVFLKNEGKRTSPNRDCLMAHED